MKDAWPNMDREEMNALNESINAAAQKEVAEERKKAKKAAELRNRGMDWYLVASAVYECVPGLLSKERIDMIEEEQKKLGAIVR